MRLLKCFVLNTLYSKTKHRRLKEALNKALTKPNAPTGEQRYALRALRKRGRRPSVLAVCREAPCPIIVPWLALYHGRSSLSLTHRSRPALRKNPSSLERRPRTPCSNRSARCERKGDLRDCTGIRSRTDHSDLHVDRPCALLSSRAFRRQPLECSPRQEAPQRGQEVFGE